MNQDLAIVVLAAGKGTRMGGDTAKVLCTVYGKPLIDYVLSSCSELKPKKIIIVTGFQREQVEGHVSNWWKEHGVSSTELSFAFQEQQLGTGHAAQCAIEELGDFSGNVLITYGDIPLVKPETFKDAVIHHDKQNATVTLISIKGEYDNWYGRVVRDTENRVTKIVERKDCNPSELLLDETNSGIYVVESSFLKPALEKLDSNNSQKEYYLTDIVEQAESEGQTVEAMVCFDADELRGINTQQELKKVERKLMNERITSFTSIGVEFSDPDSCFIDSEVTIGSGTRVGPQVVLLGKTAIGSSVTLEGCAYLYNSNIADGANLRWSIRLEDAVVGEDCLVGPFAHLRPGSVLEAEVKIGNFVETKKSTLKKGAKASHLTYLGDATVGEDANIGAGTITCNYDGYNKFETKIEAGAFIGSNSSLVAPVTIGKGASIGAGSTITKNVSEDALALTRANQKEIAGWAKNKREKNQK